MTSRRLGRCGCVLLAALAAAVLSGCAGPAATGDQLPAQAAAPAPATEPEPDAAPLETHQASAQCWMKYDKSGGSLEARSKLVNKCIDDKMKAQKPR